MASDPNPATLTLIGSILAAITGGGGLYLNARKSSDDAMQSIVNSAIGLNNEYRKRMSEQDAKIEDLTHQLAQCEIKHDRVHNALISAGILPPEDV